MSAIIANTATGVHRLSEDGWIKVTSGGMVVAVASLAGVGRRPDGGHPRQVVVKVFASLAIQPGRVVLTLALPENLVLAKHLLIVQRDASGGMTVARAGASDYHVIDGVVVLFLNFISRIQEIVTQVVKTGEIES